MFFPPSWSRCTTKDDLFTWMEGVAQSASIYRERRVVRQYIVVKFVLYAPTYKMRMDTQGFQTFPLTYLIKDANNSRTFGIYHLHPKTNEITLRN